jgi:ParB-like nuclease family protein
MATTSEETGRHIALVDIRVPDNVRDLDPEHVKALAGSIGLQGMLVPVVVRNDGEGFELVAGFHRVAAARSLGLTAVPVVIRDAQTEDADRAVENIASCRRRHDAIYADRVVMPMSELKCPTARCEPGGEVGIRTRTDPGSQAAADDLAEVGAAARLRKASARPAPGDTLAFRPLRACATRPQTRSHPPDSGSVATGHARASDVTVPPPSRDGARPD